jgi:hypothetical protein
MLTQRKIDPDAVPKAVGDLITELRTRPNLTKPVFVGRNLYAALMGRIGCCRYESPHRVLEVLPIAKRQLELDSLVGGYDVRFRGLGLLRLCRMKNSRCRDEARCRD